MGTLHPDGRRTGDSPDTLARGIAWMMTNSLLLYVVAVLLQRTWTLLNSDVMQLMRRA
jgi:hypothetical protein